MTMIGFTSLKDMLQVLLVPITLALLAPWITRRWQETQRELEIKMSLVAEISGLVMTTVMTVYLCKLTHPQYKDNCTEENELDRIYKRWRIETCVIGSKLHAYFPERQKGQIQIHNKWTQFSEKLTRYYETLWTNECSSNDKFLLDTKDALFDEKAKMIDEIIHARLTGFHPTSAK